MVGFLKESIIKKIPKTPISHKHKNEKQIKTDFLLIKIEQAIKQVLHSSQLTRPNN